MGYLGKGPGIRTVLLLRHKSRRLYYVRTLLIAHPLHISCALYLDHLRISSTRMWWRLSACRAERAQSHALPTLRKEKGHGDCGTHSDPLAEVHPAAECRRNDRGYDPRHAGAAGTRFPRTQS